LRPLELPERFGDVAAKLATASRGGLPALRRVSFQTPWSLHPSHQEQPGERPGYVFSQPRRGFLHTTGQPLLPSLHSSGTRSASGDHQQGSTSDLSSFKVGTWGMPSGEPGYAPGPSRFQPTVHCTTLCTPYYIYSEQYHLYI
jgi:hypothetical protein